MKYDGIIIGAGHNGMTTAGYLAKAGARIAVVEANADIGGGTHTRELVGAGYKSNPCASFYIGYDAAPIHRDLELHKYGFRLIIPPVQQGFVLSDGRALVLHSDIDKSVANLSRFSQRDADQFRRLHHEYQEIRAFLVASQYNPPREAARLFEGLSDRAKKEITKLRTMKPYEAIAEYFHEEPLRVLMRKLVHVTQATNTPGMGMVFASHFVNLRRMALAAGGAQALPNALAALVREHGGEIFTNTPVGRILIEDGSVRGVELENGDVLEADFVVSAVSFPQLVEMAGEENFAEGIVAKKKKWDWTGVGSLVTLHLALDKPPAYRATDFDPDLAQAFNISFGVDNSDQLDQMWEEIYRGEFPSMPAGNGAVNSLFDPSYAPPGKHVAFWWPFTSYEIDGGGAANWDRKRGEYEKRLLNIWRRYAPNLDEHNVEATFLRTPLDIARENRSMRFGSVRMGPYTPDQFGMTRPHPDMADYRVPTVKGLYHASATSPNGGGANGAAGYSAAGIIAADQGLKRFWPEMTVERAAQLIAENE